MQRESGANFSTTRQLLHDAFPPHVGNALNNTHTRVRGIMDSQVNSDMERVYPTPSFQENGKVPAHLDCCVGLAYLRETSAAALCPTMQDKERCHSSQASSKVQRHAALELRVCHPLSLCSKPAITEYYSNSSVHQDSSPTVAKSTEEHQVHHIAV